MIFTVGNKEVYDKAIAEMEANGERLIKAGLSAIGKRRTAGGACWRTQGEAELWLEQERAKPEGERFPGVESLAVYGLEAEWDRDTMFMGAEPFARLIVNRPVVKLPEEPSTCSA